MPDYDNRERGVLFKNADKNSDSSPDYRGSINVNGVDYWLSAWTKTSQKGTKFMSLSVKAKEPKKSSEPQSYAQVSQSTARNNATHASLAVQAPPGFDDSDIPF